MPYVIKGHINHRYKRKTAVMIWNKVLIYCGILFGSVNHVMLSDVNVMHKNIVKSPNINDITSPCYLCRNNTVFDAIVFHRFEHQFEGKQQIFFFLFFTFRVTSYLE